MELNKSVISAYFLLSIFICSSLFGKTVFAKDKEYRPILAPINMMSYSNDIEDEMNFYTEYDNSTHCVSRNYYEIMSQKNNNNSCPRIDTQHKSGTSIWHKYMHLDDIYNVITHSSIKKYAVKTIDRKIFKDSIGNFIKNMLGSSSDTYVGRFMNSALLVPIEIPYLNSDNMVLPYFEDIKLPLCIKTDIANMYDPITIGFVVSTTLTKNKGFVEVTKYASTLISDTTKENFTIKKTVTKILTSFIRFNVNKAIPSRYKSKLLDIALFFISLPVGELVANIIM